MPRKKSFFDRLTGAVNADEHDAFIDDMSPDVEDVTIHPSSQDTEPAPAQEAAELTVDMYTTEDYIMIHTFVAGVAPDELDVSISMEMVTISGRRDHPDNPGKDEYLHEELYWGPFARTIVLPEEIDTEGAEASENHGLLTIKLPRIDKKKATKLKILSN